MSRKVNSRIVTRSRYFNQFSRGKSVDVSIDSSTLAGVRVQERGNKKGTEVELFLPNGSKNVRISMTGRQAKSIVNTLLRHYERTGTFV
ncbi:MAG: hypothetical protein AABY22_34605 [Nanoarchaeota archaeon]